MTYREAIQKMKDDIDALYDRCGTLRDYASGSVEKEHWNALRGISRDFYSKLDSLDNRLEGGRGDMVLD